MDGQTGGGCMHERWMGRGREGGQWTVDSGWVDGGVGGRTGARVRVWASRCVCGYLDGWGEERMGARVDGVRVRGGG